ncbi:MAG TPA: dihydrolipoamide acetyltransferase family protein [Armatimonadota bacterium]|jgi:pyruvate dehydrogenase E2 component (dihydrolipoamide acetyltransferase)
MNQPSETRGAVAILMPQPGQSMEEGTIVRWLAREGDQVRKGDILFEVETDKAVLEVEAADSGRLARIVAKDGVTLPVKSLVGVLAETDAEADAFLAGAPQAVAPNVAGEAPARERTPAVEPARSGRVAASPLARKAAAQCGVSLESIAHGSGPRGRILLADVEAAVHEAAAEPEPEPRSPRPPEPGAERVPMTRMRKAIARGLVASKQTIPHFYVKLTVDAGPLMAFYRAEKAVYPCSLNDVITYACARLLTEFPAFRGRVDGDDVVTFREANIGIAVGTDEGLTVPVLRGADSRNLKGIAAETRRIVEAARAGRLEGAGEATFTITNLGMFGVEEFSAIINPPEAAILAVGAVREDIVVKDGAIRAGHRMTLTLSADHRLIDGLLAARFMARLKEMLEK